MSPDDPRHGLHAGYIAGCRQACCRSAMAAYEGSRRARRYLSRGETLLAPGTGTRRRIQALVAIGWSTHALEAEMGQRRTYLSRLLRADGPVYEATARKVADLYDRLSMTLPPRNTQAQRQSATRAQNHAKRVGWLPPLMWDDIDNDAEPVRASGSWGESSIDAAVVQRVLNGDPKPRQLTNAECSEIVHALIARGLTGGQIETRYGFKVERYYRVRENVA